MAPAKEVSCKGQITQTHSGENHNSATITTQLAMNSIQSRLRFIVNSSLFFILYQFDGGKSTKHSQNLPYSMLYL